MAIVTITGDGNIECALVVGLVRLLKQVVVAEPLGKGIALSI